MEREFKGIPAEIEEMAQAHYVAWNTPYTNKKGTFMLGDLNVEHLRNIYKLLQARNVKGSMAELMVRVHLVIQRKEWNEKVIEEETRRKKLT